jgi:hypothetical protein
MSCRGEAEAQAPAGAKPLCCAPTSRMGLWRTVTGSARKPSGCGDRVAGTQSRCSLCGIPVDCHGLRRVAPEVLEARDNTLS